MQIEADASPGHPLAGAALGTMLSYHAAIVGASLTLPVLAPEAARAIGVNADYVGYYASLIFVMATVASLFTSGLVGRYGALRTSQISLLLATGGVALLLPGGMLMAVGSGLLIGLAYGPVNPVGAHLLVAHTPPHRRALLFSIKQSSVPIGGALTGVMLPFLVHVVGWRGAVMGMLGLCLVLAAAFQWWRGRLDHDRRPTTSLIEQGLIHPVREVLRHPRMREMVLSIMAFSAMQFCVNAFYVTYLVQGLRLELAQAGSALSLVLVVSVAGRLLWGWVADRFMARPVLAVLGLIMTAGCVALGSMSPGWGYPAVLALSVLLGGTAFAWAGVALAELARLSGPQGATLATAGAMFFAYLGALTGPALFSALVTLTTGYTAGFLLLAALTLGPSLNFLRSGPNRAQRLEESGASTPEGVTGGRRSDT